MALTLEDLIIEPEQLSFTDRKQRDLFLRKPKNAEFILIIEGLWEEFALEFDSKVREQRLEKLLKALHFTIKQKAEELERKWVNKKISAAEFEHEFMITAWKLCEGKYSPYSPYYLHETFLLALKSKGIDVVRKHTIAKKRAVNTNCLPLLDNASDWISNGEDIEQYITDKLLSEQILSDGKLLEQEKRLIQFRYENPGLSLRETGVELGMHVEIVRRTYRSIKRKLTDYELK